MTLRAKSIVWEKGTLFTTEGDPLKWSVLDSDLDTETVLGYREDGETRIFYFNQIKAVR